MECIKTVYFSSFTIGSMGGGQRTNAKAAAEQDSGLWIVVQLCDLIKYESIQT